MEAVGHAVEVVVAIEVDDGVVLATEVFELKGSAIDAIKLVSSVGRFAVGVAAPISPPLPWNSSSRAILKRGR